MKRLLEEVAARLSPEIPALLLDEDIQKLARHVHGPYAWSCVPGRPLIMFGAGSGLYPFAHALGNPESTIVLVEEDGERRRLLRLSAERLHLPGVIILESVAQALEVPRDGFPQPAILGISYPYARREILEAIGIFGTLDYLFGEFDEYRLNGLWLHEFSRSAAERFHWFNRTVDMAMVGRRSAGPLLSVVVPAYGVEKYLDKCLQSLADQPVESCEIIVVDDGARDGSGAIADLWAAQDCRIRVIHQANAGCAAARSRGLRSAAGVFVGFVDGDDWAEPPMYRALLESAVRYGSDMAQCGYREFHESTGRFKRVKEAFRFSHAMAEGNGLAADPLDYLVSKPAIWRRIYRRDFLQFHGIDFAAELPRFDDLPFQFMTLSLAERLSVIPEPYYCYRQQRPGQDVAVDDERLFVHFPMFRLLREFLDGHYSPALEKQLKLVQVATHFWGAGKIAPRLRDTYLAAAAQDIFGQTVSLSTGDMLRAVYQTDKRWLPWLFGLYGKQARGRAVWEASQYFKG